VHHSPILAEIKEKLQRLVLRPGEPVFDLHVSNNSILAEVKEKLRKLAPRPGEPVFDLHGSSEITSKCITEKSVKPEDLVLHLPKGSRTRQQCIEVLNHPKTREKCNYAKAKKKDRRRVAKCTERNRYEWSVQKSGGTVGKRCKRGANYCAPFWDVARRSEAMIELNDARAYFRSLLKKPPTLHLPPPSIYGFFRNGAEALAFEFTVGQLLPSVDLLYTETSRNRYSEVACTWATNLSYWERDFDLDICDETEADLEILSIGLQCKGFGHWVRSLYKSLASTDYDRRTSAPFLAFYRLFRRMAHFAIRHLVNGLQGEYQNRGPHLPILYAGYASLNSWLKQGLRVGSASGLLDLYVQETVSFWNRFERLFERVFPLEAGILNEAFARAKQVCAAIRKADLRLSARDVAVHVADALREVKAECNYDNDREECRARFEELVAEVNHLSSTTRMTREQALYHLLPRPPRKPRKM